MRSFVRSFGVAVASATLALGMAATSASANPGQGPESRSVPLQLLSFNDFHGHLVPESGKGGAAGLAGTVAQLRAQAGDRNSITVSDGDNIGGSTFLSGMFHDEPTIEVLNAMRVDVSAVGNHEFDEGVSELFRMQNGGCHPVDCFYPKEPYQGAKFPYLAANVISKKTGQPILPGSWVTRVQGAKVGFIGVVTTDTSFMVSPSGIADVTFIDEAEATNREVAKLRAQGVESIVLLLHEGGKVTGTDANACNDLTGKVTEINQRVSSAVDVIVTGHTHFGYVCSLLDPSGQPRLVTQAGSWGDHVTEINLKIDLKTKDIRRDAATAVNHPITSTSPQDPTVAAIVAKWEQRSAPVAGRVVGTVAADITGDASGTRDHETPMGDLLADAILAGTSGANGGAQLAFMNVGGVRASLLTNQITNGEKVGEITYAEAYNVAPFGNQLVTVDMTGDQIRRMLNQQYVESRSRKQLALGVSAGFSYTWDPATRSVVAGSMTLNGQPMSMTATYRVATLNFLAEGGDGFTVFKEATNLTGGAEDLANLVAYLQANPGLTPPPDRVAGI